MVKGLRESLTRVYQSPRALLSELNKRLYGILDQKIFITMIYTVIDMEKKLPLQYNKENLLNPFFFVLKKEL